ncbi:serine hydrolase [Bacteroides caecigallinarum]|uniref:serine hydrolase domain-containing protein n=1 Tax=Bacteroides caecigallinarum TaxID=1411144 RepID=UPI00195E7783|nr:serine hydrolase [Bacteroides caecigallinarum]MBM6865005.1 serine hydrolase [Bacteroides caecigallinarum]
MKTWKKILIAIPVAVIIAYLCLPFYAKKALIYWFPTIDDLNIFEHATVHAPDSCWEWAISDKYNSYKLSKKDSAYIDDMKTVSFLVIRNDSILYETYRGGWNDTLTSNLFSATKSIVGMLVGIAMDEGKIGSVDDKVMKYIPEYNRGRQKDITIRNLLTMSAGMDWDEAYASLFSVTTHGYYGNDLYKLIMGLDIVDTPGVQYSYRSGETQLLSFVLEAATGETISKYAEKKLWRPMMAGQDAFWLLDKKDGDEKSFCCFHTTARDAARFGRLMLNMGNWNGRQLVSRKYMEEALAPASYLKDQWGKDPLTYYGYQTWIMNYNGERCPYFRGMLGQYIIAIPSKNAVVVRLGHKRSREYVKELTTDIIRYMEIAEKILQ